MKNITVYYRDELGEVGVDIDFYNIQFVNGEAYFSSNGEEYRIPMDRLIEIVSI